ncbi:hypothetical protein D9M68_908040 [compost metagenome]
MPFFASTREMQYSRPVRSLADTLSSQRWAFSSGRRSTRGVTGKLLTRRDSRPLFGAGSGPRWSIVWARLFSTIAMSSR